MLYKIYPPLTYVKIDVKKCQAFANETKKDDQVIFSGRRRYSTLSNLTQILSLYDQQVSIMGIQTQTYETVY